MVVAAGISYDDAVRWARPHVALLAAVTTLGTTERPILCDDCGATWTAPPNTPCPWCQEADARALADYRHNLLHPAWMDDQGPTYDALSDVDKAVWDHTRGITRGEASIAAWAARLVDAVHADVITELEAELATARAERWAT